MELVTEIINKKLPVIIVSPHPDDAVLSCGWLLEQLSGKVNCFVINIFTKANKGPYTFSTKRFLKASGDIDALSLSRERKKEDEKVQKILETKVIDLGIEDALFRRKKERSFLGKFIPEVDHVYPTYRWHIIKGKMKNDPAILELKKALKPFVHKKAIFFIPYGIGEHVDHVLASVVCKELFSNVIFYSDFPYNVRGNNYGEETGMRVFKLKQDMQKKVDLLKLYKTQFNGLFPQGIVPEHAEMFFVPKEHSLLSK